MFGYMKPRKEFFEAIQILLKNYNNEEYLIIGDSLKSDVLLAMNCELKILKFREFPSEKNSYN